MYRYVIILFLLFLVACNNHSEPATNEAVSSSASEGVPVAIPYQLIKEYPHDPTAFTEGLEFINGELYESTGEYRTSDVRRVALESGKVLVSKKMDAKYFGEGLTVMNGKVYQLTYREHTGFVYDAKTLKLDYSFIFDAPEGWGMTHDSKYLIYDDGTNILHYLDPATLKEVKTLSVTDEHGNVNAINELEYIKGYIYANQWRTDYILKIDPATGKVVGRADLSDLRQKTGIPAWTGTDSKAPEVMNGIAYDSATNRIFITGKFWSKLFEIKLDN